MCVLLGWWPWSGTGGITKSLIYILTALVTTADNKNYRESSHLCLSPHEEILRELKVIRMTRKKIDFFPGVIGVFSDLNMLNRHFVGHGDVTFEDHFYITIIITCAKGESGRKKHLILYSQCIGKAMQWWRKVQCPRGSNHSSILTFYKVLYKLKSLNTEQSLLIKVVLTPHGPSG